MRIGSYIVSGTETRLEGSQGITPVYQLRFLEDCEIGESKFYKGQLMDALAHGAFSAKGKAEVYDWTLQEFVPIGDALPRLPT